MFTYADTPTTIGYQIHCAINSYKGKVSFLRVGPRLMPECTGTTIKRSIDQDQNGVAHTRKQCLWLYYISNQLLLRYVVRKCKFTRCVKHVKPLGCYSIVFNHPYGVNSDIKHIFLNDRKRYVRNACCENPICIISSIS